MRRLWEGGELYRFCTARDIVQFSFFLRCALWLCNKQALNLCRNEQHFNVQFRLVVKKPALPVYVSDAALHLSQEIMRI
jgi:hypothetical protein